MQDEINMIGQNQKDTRGYSQQVKVRMHGMLQLKENCCVKWPCWGFKFSERGQLFVMEASDNGLNMSKSIGTPGHEACIEQQPL